jgi:single-strand DNA-binding protein
MNINAVLLSGVLGKDPQTVKHHNGKLVRLSLITEENHLNEQGRLIKTSQLHPLTAWGKEADMAEKLLKKGSPVYIEGKLVHNHYSDRSGVVRKVSEVKIVGLKILD